MFQYCNYLPVFVLSSLRLCDEATSALDSTTEAEILSALKSLANDRTSIFVAHRLTTAMQCDEVTFLYLGSCPSTLNNTEFPVFYIYV